MASEGLWVADASVMINILATGEPLAVLDMFPGAVVSPPQALGEVKKCPIDGSHKQGLLLPLIEGGYLQEVELSEEALNIFLELVGAPPPNDLDDGEAAVIACAVAAGAGAIIDEAKGQRICREKYPHLRIWSSCDLFRFCLEEAKGEAEVVRHWINNARARARMRVPFHFKEWFSKLVDV